MGDQLCLRGGTATETAAFTGAPKEVTVNTTDRRLHVHDGATLGGTPLAKQNGDTLTGQTLIDPTLSGAVKMDVISEKTVNAGVTVDGVVLKDGGVTMAACASPTGTLSLIGNQTVSGTLTASGAATVGSTLGVTGLLTATAGIRSPVGTATYYGQAASTQHSAGNVGSICFGTSDGAGWTGLIVYNTHNGTYSSQSVGINTSYGGSYGSREILRITSAAEVHPGMDAAYPLGSGGYRWAVVYSATGAINTSDAREKTAVTTLSAAELTAAKALAAEIGTFQFLSAIQEKGQDRARHHAGLTVQRAMDILTANGLDPNRYGFICHDEWQAETGEDGTVTREAGDRYSFRTDELLLFMARGFDARLSALEAAAQ